ncbi:LamG-like jellyroll fold domain-containing protein [Flavobacterium sp.]|uniref:LamG-like jellyroll fold domain-containing protein n=1 Tax=Flavobacterium sp. TaxID=239 RepID=UPI002608D3BB|nr:LamG-like jellyroll fold domain-containing protein [Flavobacterium sp.]
MKKLLHFLLLIFVVGISNAQTPVYQFNFDGNVNNSGTGAVSSNFTANSGAFFQYGADRNGNANSAIFATPFNDGAVCPNLPSGTSARTISSWIKLSPQGTPGLYAVSRIIGYGMNTANQAFGFDFPSNTNMNFYVWGSNDFSLNIVNSLTNGWVHVAMTYDGTSIKRYVNGVLVNTTNAVLNTNTVSSGNRLSLGKYANETVANPVNCMIDDFRIYDVALTQAQISNLYSPAVLPVISNISSSLIHEGANISYTVNAGGASTTTTVLYGQTAAANELAATGTTATGTTNTACTATTQYNLSAAAAGTTMYYRIQATNSAGTVFSPTLTYTQVAKPTYEVNAPTNITTSASQINYVLKPNGGNSTSVVKYGLSASNLNNTATGFSALGFTDNFSNVQLTGLAPNTLYYYAIEGTNAYGVSQSSVSTFTTLGNGPLLSMVNVSNIQTTSATVNFSLNTSNASTTTVINYGTSSSNLNLSASGPTVTSTTATSYNALLAGLTPNTTYYFSVVATNGSGTAASGVSQFTTAALGAIPSPIYNFEFNNNFNSQDGSVTLNTPIGGSHAFVSNGTVSNGALELINARTQTSLPNLPVGSSARSVHIKVKYDNGAFPGENYLFNWGTGATGQAFAGHQTASTVKLLGWGGTNYDYDLVPNSGATTGVWYEYMFVYFGTEMNVYRDGQLLGSKVITTLNTTGDSFRMGINPGGIVGINADIDYVRIFNQALTQGQVTQIYNNPNLLSSDNFSSNNLKFNLYPNPASNILNIEIDGSIKLVEIYSLQGQKVLETNQTEINISNLASGMYVVKVQDLSGSFATKKLIIE